MEELMNAIRNLVSEMVCDLHRDCGCLDGYGGYEGEYEMEIKQLALAIVRARDERLRVGGTE